MEINYKLNENGKIISWSSIPFDPTLPYIECEKPHEEIYLGFSEIIDGKLYTNIEEMNKENKRQEIRRMRETECFKIVNRGLVWYNKFTKTQKEEIQKWYEDWLEAPNTLIIPEKPEFLT